MTVHYARPSGRPDISACGRKGLPMTGILDDVECGMCRYLTKGAGIHGSLLFEDVPPGAGVAYLRNLAGRIKTRTKRPTVRDVDTLLEMANELEKMEKAIAPREPDPEALMRHLVMLQAGGVVWQFREDVLDVKDAYRAWIEAMDAENLIGLASYIQDPEQFTPNADHD